MIKDLVEPMYVLCCSCVASEMLLYNLLSRKSTTLATI